MLPLFAALGSLGSSIGQGIGSVGSSIGSFVGQAGQNAVSEFGLNDPKTLLTKSIKNAIPGNTGLLTKGNVSGYLGDLMKDPKFLSMLAQATEQNQNWKQRV